MTVGAGRVDDASIDSALLEAVTRWTRFAHCALRSRSAFFWSSADGPTGLLSLAGDADGIDAVAMATSLAAQVLAAPGPIALGTAGALGGVAVRVGDGRHGVLFVADAARRTFDQTDLALIDEVGASLARELEQAASRRATPKPAADDETAVPLNAIVRLSDALVRSATSGPMLSARDYLAAADHLARVAVRLRELAGTVSRSPAPSAGWTPGRESPPPGTGGRSILLADDLDLNRKLISDMLTMEGHHVDCVADGAAAVHAVQAKAYDLVLMDMIMPEMDGVAATRAIRALPTPACRVPIVALTANTFREQLDSCLEAGMDATLTKPMTFEALTKTVAAWACDRTAAA